MKASDIDRSFDRGEDVLHFFDLSTAQRPNQMHNGHMADPALAQQLETCLTAYSIDRTPDPDIERAAVKATLGLLTASAPGKSVEVRVPPYAAVQAVEGVKHRRGTPAAVVECDGRTWLQLATGALTWADAVASGRLRASGERSDLSAYLPLA
jgi:hypothetical protein